MKSPERWLYPVAVLCLLLSGVAGLVYQVVWARYLALFLGHTSYAVIAVLVAFMGGLALGNAWVGRVADRVARPLALYAWLELGIAVYAVLFPTYFELCQDGYVGLARGHEPGGAWTLGLKFIFSSAAILVPTTLMGGTLPVLTRLVTRSLGELRARVAGLYFINSLGAVAGVLIAEYLWIPSQGLVASLYWGAMLNGVVGVVALVFERRMDGAGWSARRWRSEEERREMGAAGDEPAVPETYTVHELRLAVAAAGVSGFVAMLYEIVWTRILALSLGSSTHAFAIMLATFIGGIATGAWWVGRWRRGLRTLDAFGWAELALAVVLLVSMCFYHLLPYWFGWLGAVITRAPANFGFYGAAQFAVCLAVMFGPALCLGITLPLASRAATAELAGTGRSVGLVFSVNTLGTVLGAALTGLWLLPWLGLARTFALGVALNVVVALMVLLRGNPRASRAVALAAPVGVVVFLGLAQAVLGTLWDKAFSLGLWRVPQPPSSVGAYLDLVRSFEVRFHRDGAGSTVVVSPWRNPADGRTELSLRVNGKADATTRGDLPTQMLLAHLPLLIRDAASEVMVVGIGSGITVASALSHPEVRHVDVVEISPEVRDAARQEFGQHNRGALDDARVSVVIDDAKSFLRTTGRRYDVIVSEPSNPWMAGVAGVFSQEFYRTCQASLKPGGIMVQWVHIYESSDEALQMVLATYTSVFPFLTVWQTLPGDLVLVGADHPLQVDLAAMQRRFEVPEVTADLRRADLFAFPVLLGLQLVSESNAPFLAPAGTALHSDFRPRLEYVAERGFFARNEAELHLTFDENLLRRPSTLLGTYLERHPLTAGDVQSFALFHNAFHLPRAAVMRSIVERWRELAPDSTLPAEFSAKMEFPLSVAELEAGRMARVRGLMMDHAATELEPLRMYSRHLMRAYRDQRSVYFQPSSKELKEVLGRLIEVDDLHRSSHLLRLAEIAWDEGEEAKFFEVASRAFLPAKGAAMDANFSLDHKAPGQVLSLILETLWRERRFQEARRWSDAIRAAGYARPESQYYTPGLAMSVRKIEATLPGP